MAKVVSVQGPKKPKVTFFGDAECYKFLQAHFPSIFGACEVEHVLQSETKPLLSGISPFVLFAVGWEEISVHFQYARS